MLGIVRKNFHDKNNENSAGDRGWITHIQLAIISLSKIIFSWLQLLFNTFLFSNSEEQSFFWKVCGFMINRRRFPQNWFNFQLERSKHFFLDIWQQAELFYWKTQKNWMLANLFENFFPKKSFEIFPVFGCLVLIIMPVFLCFKKWNSPGKNFYLNVPFCDPNNEG